MTNIWEFINQDNLQSMTRNELIDLWGLLISDYNRMDIVDRIKSVLDNRSK
jgi:hypothetical protein